MSISNENLDELKDLIHSSMLKDHWNFINRFRRLKKRLGQRKPIERDYLTLLEQAEASSKTRKERSNLNPLISYPESLPISQYTESIVKQIQENQVLVIAGETGSGKTTQIPKMCLEAGLGIAGKIGCTQPRRVAATSIAQQTAKELETELGQMVGYKIRFAEKTSPSTLIQFMTDGTLLAETQTDRFLNAYDMIIIDEAHERSLNIDFLLGYIKNLLLKRQDLKVIITSASIDPQSFSQSFNNAPIIEVSGRTYPVDIQYRPLDEKMEEEGDFTMEDAVVATVNELLQTTWEGDILVFMTGEREINDVTKRLQGSGKQAIDILPLYSRLSHKDQHRIFQDTSNRKVIVATNIAETSITIPGIRYVVDTGLARISRYSHRSNIQRLPVESISQSSAIQRSGRAGRMESGVCIRLYSEESFRERRQYFEPEILRSNLAGVILQMLALKLGDLEKFPFVDPPAPKAVRQGFQLLRELGAVDEQDQLTRLGKEMARLPIEPRTARMLLAAQQENALREVLIIAAGLSIQDPREYPLEKKEQAKQMHQGFVNHESDFITLLNIWNAYHDQWDSLRTENQMRKFCKKHYLSFYRLREWRDIYRQLQGILRESNFKLNTKPADYRGIHVSILSGHLNHVAEKQEKNMYKAAGGREIIIFPGSSLHGKAKTWIVAAELVETSRLFARSVANIEVDWLEKIGGSLCKRSYSEAHFDEESGRVLAFEKVTLYGLTIVAQRKVAYGRINPAETTAIFIREGLVDEKLVSQHEFYKHNKSLKQKLLKQGSKLRKNFEFEIELAQEKFYQEHLYNIFSIHDLNRVIKEQRLVDNHKFLFMNEEDICPSELLSPSQKEYPDYWDMGNKRLKLDYQFNPESDRDGVTLRIHDNMLPYIDPKALEWLVPGQWEERIFYLLKGLPKSVRKQFVPIPDTAKKLSEKIQPGNKTFISALETLIQKEYGITIQQEEWTFDKLPDYLKIRVELRDKSKKIIATGREIEDLLIKRKQETQNNPQSSQFGEELESWKKAQEQWELRNLHTWSFDTLPLRIEIAVYSGIPLYAYPGLYLENGEIHRTLYHARQEAMEKTRPALRQLLALNVGSELAWLDKDLSTLREFRDQYEPFGPVSQLKDQAKQCIYDYLFGDSWIENKKSFEKRVSQAVAKLKGLWPQFTKALETILTDYNETLKDLYKYQASASNSDSFEELFDHLSNLLPKDFVWVNPYVQWRHVPRYLKALRIRAERLAFNPEKDEEKYEQLQPWLEYFRELQSKPADQELSAYIDEFKWMIEEFRVSLFAPEVKTAGPISAKRLEKFKDKYLSHR